MSGKGLNHFTMEATVPPLDEVYMPVSRGGTTSASYGSKTANAGGSGSTSGSARSKTDNKPYRPPAARQGASARGGTTSGSAAKTTGGEAGASAGSAGKTSGGYNGKHMSDIHKSYAHSTWHPDWLGDAESHFKLVKFRLRRRGPRGPTLEVVQAFARRQSLAHTTKNSVWYNLGTDTQDEDKNMKQIKVAKDRHFPVAFEGGSISSKELEGHKFNQPMYTDMMKKYFKQMEYNDIVEDSLVSYSSGMVVPQEVAICDANLMQGSKGDVVGITISGMDEVFHVKKSYDAHNQEGTVYNAIITHNSAITKTVYEYYPQDHVAHYETMYGPIGENNFEKCFDSKINNVTPIHVTSPVFLYMLCNIAELFSTYLEDRKDKTSEWERIIDKNLTVFFRKNKQLRMSIFDDNACEFDDAMLSDIIDNIFDQRESAEETSYPPWTFNLQGNDIVFYLPHKFKDIIKEAYFTHERRDVFEKDKFNIIPSKLTSTDTNPSVSLTLDVDVFVPIFFSYVRYCTE